jgi:hypothetical protein
MLIDTHARVTSISYARLSRVTPRPPQSPTHLARKPHANHTQTSPKGTRVPWRHLCSLAHSDANGHKSSRFRHKVPLICTRLHKRAHKTNGLSLGSNVL